MKDFFFCDGDAAVTRISSSRTNWSFYQKWNDVLWDTIGALQFFCVNLIFFVCVPFASSYSYVKWRTYSLWQICAHIALPSCLLVLFCHISFFCWPPSTNKFGVCAFDGDIAKVARTSHVRNIIIMMIICIAAILLEFGSAKVSEAHRNWPEAISCYNTYDSDHCVYNAPQNSSPT